MFSRARRCSSMLTKSEYQVGPATYLLYDSFDNISKKLQTRVPFNSSSARSTSFANKSIAANPSPNKYKICVRKHRIIGGSSLRNKEPRRTPQNVCSRRGPYPIKQVKYVPGKVCHGVPPRADVPKVTTIPEKGVEGYEITCKGPVKIVHQLENRAIGPAEYYNPKGQTNFTTSKYKGNFWSLRTALRFRYKQDEGPSPADYAVYHSSTSKGQKNHNNVQRGSEAPLFRYLDMVQRKQCRENMPGPAQYFPKDPNTKECCSGNGTFSKADVKRSVQTQNGPGPVDYDTQKPLFKPVSHICSPFNVTADRFLKSKEGSHPGPADYNLQNDIWSEIQKKGQSKYSTYSAPFDSSTVRKTSFINPESGCIPGPDYYSPQFQKRGDGNKSSVFASTSSRTPLTLTQGCSGPMMYSITDAFNAISTKKCHLQNTNSAFLTSGPRLRPLDLSFGPAPTTYNLPASTFSDKGCTFGPDLGHRAQDITPGPADYKVHVKHARSSVFNTFNISLQSPKHHSKPNIKTGSKRLRSFSNNKYVTGHC